MVLAAQVLHNRRSIPLSGAFRYPSAFVRPACAERPSLQESGSSTPQVREQFLVIGALGANPMELTSVLCRASQENRCGVVSSRLTRHGEYSALVLQVNGS